MSSRPLLLVLVSFAIYLQYAESSMLEEVKEINKRDVNRRQTTNYCSKYLLNYPQSCNATLLLDDNVVLLLNNTPHLLTDEHLDQLNTAYGKICRAECFDPIIAFDRCYFAGTNNDELLEFYERLERQGICGKEGNDFCEVHYLRFYRRNVTFINTLVTNCHNVFTSSGINCNWSPTRACRQMVAEFITNMGCCARPILGDGITGCTTSTVKPACASQIGIATSAIVAIIVVVIIFIMIIIGAFVLTVVVVLMALNKKKNIRIRAAAYARHIDEKDDL
jgi:hypothetical protein